MHMHMHMQMSRQGKARQGKARQGKASLSKSLGHNQNLLISVRHFEALHGKVDSRDDLCHGDLRDCPGLEEDQQAREKKLLAQFNWLLQTLQATTLQVRID
jgi:hypothetical protein